MGPTGADVHHDVPLSNLAVMAFNAGTEEFIANQVMPEVGVGKQSDKYYVIDKGAFLRVPATFRAPKTEAKRIDFSVSSDSYFADNYALANENALEDLANADQAIMLRENSVNVVVTALLRDQEIRVANLLTSASNVGSGVLITAADDKWDSANSDPISHVNTAHAFIRQNTGLRANTMVIDEDTLVTVRRHPLLLDMYKYTAGGMLNDAQLKEVFHVDNILVGRGIKENAKEGGTSSITNIWGNNVLIAHIMPASGMQTHTLGLRFRWRAPGLPADMGVIRSVMNGAGSKKVEVVETGYYQAEKIVASDLGYLIATPIN